MKRLMTTTLLSALFLVACGTPTGYDPYVTRGVNTGDKTEEYDQFTLQRTACFGFCPVYEVLVDERDVLVFKGERFVREDEGAVSKRLPDGSFRKLIRIAKDHDFSSYDAAYPDEDGSNCPSRATDMPSVIVSFDAARLSHSVSLYQGCMGFEGREDLDAMILEIDKVLDLDSFIGPREAFYGGEEETQ